MTFIDAAAEALGLVEEAREWWDDNQVHYVGNSTNVTSFQYDRETRKLIITFHGGRGYIYSNISPDTVEGLATAPSAGEWFHRNLKGAPFEKV